MYIDQALPPPKGQTKKSHFQIFLNFFFYRAREASCECACHNFFRPPHSDCGGGRVDYYQLQPHLFFAEWGVSPTAKVGSHQTTL